MSVAWVGAGIAAVGLVAGQSNAKSAVNAQEDAANSANATSMAQYDQTRADQMPFLNNGTAASNQLAYLLGLPGASSTGGTPDIRSIISQSVGQSYDQGYLPGTGDNTKADAINGALLNYSNGLYGSAADAYKKFTGSDFPAQSTSPTDPNFGSLLKQFDQSDLDADPIYQSSLAAGLTNGNQGINRQAASNGSLNSGATIKALARFSTNLGASLGNDAFNRNSAYKTGVYNDLAGVSGGGQTASTQIGNAGAAAAANEANNTLAVGNSRAASAIGQTNSINSGISSAAQYYQNQQLLNRLNTPAANNPTIYGADGGGSGFVQTGSISY